MAQGQETQEAYKFPQKGWVLDNLFDTLLSWLSGSSLSAGSFSTSGEVTANGHNLTQKANKSEVDSSINTINGTLALKANTTDVNSADNDIIARLQGVKSDYNINDPILRKNFDTTNALNSYLSTLHGNSWVAIPHGLVWLDLQGSKLWLFNSPKSFADDIWYQFLIGGKLLSNGQITNGNDIFIRECSNGTWQSWKRLVNHEEVISTIEAQSLTEAQKAQVRVNIGTDEAPTYNSQNLVKSGGVKSAIDYAYNNSVGVGAQSFNETQKAQARTNIGAASQSDLNSTNTRVSSLETTKANQSDLNSTNQEVAKKAEVIDLQQYVGKRVPTCDYEFMRNYMPYYTYGEYPIQWGIVEEPDEESNNDFYYVGRFTSNDGITFGYLSFSNKGDWGFRGGNQGFFTEDNVPEALKQAIYAFGLSREKVMDAQDAAIGGKPLRTVKENGVMVYPVSHSGAIVHDLNAETTVFEEIEALKQGRKVIYVEFWDDENPPMHKESASVGDLFYKTDTGVLYKAYENDGEILFGIEPILEGALYIYNYGDFFGIGKIVENAGVLHLLHYQTTAEQAYNGLMSAGDKQKLDTIYNFGRTQGWWQ